MPHLLDVEVVAEDPSSHGWVDDDERGRWAIADRWRPVRVTGYATVGLVDRIWELRDIELVPR